MANLKKQYRNGKLRGPVNANGKLIRNGEPTFTATNKRRLTADGSVFRSIITRSDEY